MKELSLADAVAQAIDGLVRVAAYEGVTIEEIRETFGEIRAAGDVTFEDVGVLRTLFAEDWIRFEDWFVSALVAYADQFEASERDEAYVSVFARVGEEF